jgi:hypothetical protein
MTFGEAIDAAKLGGYYKRTGWQSKAITSITDPFTNAVSIIEVGNGALGFYRPADSDLTADDWSAVNG